MQKRNVSPLLKSFSKYVSLNVAGMLGLTCYILADTFFVANKLGASGLTALSIALPIFSIINGIGLMLGMGAATKFAILVDNAKEKNVIFTNAILIATVFSAVLVTLGGFFASDIARLLGADSVVEKMTTTYIQVLLFFSPAFIYNNIITCFIRNDGKPYLSMIAMVVGSVANIFLDYLFMYPCDMGIFGAILATGLSPIISLSILSFHFILKRNTFKFVKIKLSFKPFITICSLGIFSLIAEFSYGIMLLIFNKIILRLEGNLGVAAYSIVANIAFVTVGLFSGVAQGAQPLLSACYGRGDTKSTKKLLGYSIATVLTFSVILYAVINIFSSQLINAFNSEKLDNLQRIAEQGLLLYFIGLPFLSINVIFSAYYSATDKPTSSFAISLLRGLVVVIPMAFLMSSLLGMTGVWITVPISEFIVTCVVIIMVLYSCKNKKNLIQ